MEDKPRFDEPWKRIKGRGDASTPSMGYVAQHRTMIKNSHDAPHLAVVMPIGNKSEQIVGMNGDGEPKVVREYRQPGLVPIELMINEMQVAQPLNVSLTWLVKKNNLSSILREEMTHQALALGVNYIFYWDDDVLIPSNTWYRMMNHMSHYPDIGAITGVVWTRVNPSEPILYKDPSRGSYWGFDRNPEAPPEDIFAAGAGCMLVRVEALRRMQAPYWADERKGNEEGTHQSIVGHDIGFFKKLKNETGYRCVVDGSIQCNHFDIETQTIFHAPDDMPNVEDVRQASDVHVNMERDAGEPRSRTEDEILEALTHDVS